MPPDLFPASSPITTRRGHCGRASKAARSFLACRSAFAALQPRVVHTISASGL